MRRRKRNREQGQPSLVTAQLKAGEVYHTAHAKGAEESDAEKKT